MRSPNTATTATPPIRFEIVNVTPEQAAAWLAKKATNRVVRNAAVYRLVDDMKKHAWMLTHQAIAFDADGVVIDGEHRLTAIVKSGIACEMVVARYANNADAYQARMRMDIGSKRNLGDMLVIAEKVTDRGRERCAVARLIYALEHGGDHAVSVNEEEDLVLMYAAAHDAIRIALPGRRTTAMQLAPFVWAWNIAKDPSEIDSLAARLHIAEGLNTSEATLLRVLNEKTSDGTAGRVAYVHCILRGISAVLAGRDVKQLRRMGAITDDTIDRFRRQHGR